MRSDGLPALRWVQPHHKPSAALRWALFWMGSVGVLGLLDGWRATRHDGSTISELTRVAFATHTPSGRLAFAACWGAASALFLRHILHR